MGVIVPFGSSESYISLFGKKIVQSFDLDAEYVTDREGRFEKLSGIYEMNFEIGREKLAKTEGIHEAIGVGVL